LLKKLAPAAATLRGNRREAIEQLFGKDQTLLDGPERFAISADLKAASDGLSFELINIVWKILKEKLKLP